jgi:hypothetical protein
MEMSGFRLGAAVIAILATAGAAEACGSGKVVFEDKFTTLAPTWGAAGEELDVSNGQLVMKPKANYTYWLPNTASVYDDIDMCAQTTSIAAIDPSNGFAGLVFWYIDDSNFYTFEYDATGSAAVFRRQRGKWLKQIDWQKADALKPGDGSTNELRVVTLGNKATFFINGKKFNEITGIPPDNGQEVGFIASSPEKGVASYGFSDFILSEPQK